MSVPRAVHIIGVPLDLGAGRRGVDMGPSAFRIAGLDTELERLGIDLTDTGDILSPTPETKSVGDPTRKYIREIALVCQQLLERSLESLRAKALPLVLGGDHSIGAGSVAAAAAYAREQSRPISLLWVDAHGDMNTPESSESGNVHGMPLAALLGGEPSELAGLGGFSPKVRPERTFLLGIRNLDDRERELVHASGVRVFTMKDIDRHGVAAIAEQALAMATAGGAHLHVSFDMDACDPSIAPGVGTPVKGGLDYREAHTLMEIIAESESLTSLDMVEVNPILDERNSTATLGTGLVLSALGKRIL